MTTIRKKVGSVPVDSGQIIIIDPCYVFEDRFEGGDTPSGGKYDAVCRLTLAENHGDILSGFATATYHGDGNYPVYAEVDSRGRILRLTINFHDDEPEDEECFGCGEYYCDGGCLDD